MNTVQDNARSHSAVNLPNAVAIPEIPAVHKIQEQHQVLVCRHCFLRFLTSLFHRSVVRYKIYYEDKTINIE